MDSIAEQLVSRLRQDPNDTPAYEALKAHYRSLGDVASLANLLEGWAGFQTSGALASEALLEAARVLREAGAERERVRTLYKQAVESDAENDEAALELIAFLEEGDEPSVLAEFLDGYLRTLETHDVSPAFVADLYTRLGDLWKTAFERPDVARPCYERALELDPSHTAAAYALRKLAQEAGDTALVAELYAVEAEAEADPERKLQLHARLADLHAQELDDLDGAIQALRSALAVAPGDIQIMHQLASYLSQRAERMEGADRARDQRRVAELYYQIAQGVEPSDAVAYLQAALGAAPQHDGALAMLEQLAPQQGASELLPALWVAYLASAGEGPEVDQRRLYLAEAYEQSGQLDDAIFCLEQARSDGQVARYLAELRDKRGLRPSGPPRALSEPPPTAATTERPTDVPVAPQELARDVRPTTRPGPKQRKPASERPLDVSPQLAQLRKAVHDLVAQRKNDDAAALCREILELDPSDPEAFSLLESHYRKSRDHAALRLLLLASTRSGGLSVDARKLRLREVAGLCEGKLKDTDGAIEAWQSVVALDPADVEAGKSLKRLLQKAQRWDDLAAVLEREALATTSAKEKIDLISQIAAIHRDKRKDLVEAAEALRQLLSLSPSDAIRDELCEMLLSVESYADALPLLRERAEQAEDEREKLRLWRLIASTAENKLHDDEAAFEANLAIVALRPKDADALVHMQAIDERTGNVTRLLSTLERRALVALRGERPSIFVRMGEIAERNLNDVDKAAEYYGNALDLEPGHEAALRALTEMFEQRGRYADLVELLRERVLVEKDPLQRVEMYRSIARLSAEHLSQPQEAAEAYRGVLSAKEDEEALRFLVQQARDDSNAEELAKLLPRLTTLTTDESERCALLFELAELLEAPLDRPRDALAALREIVERVDPSFEPALVRFGELCERLGDLPGLALALHRQLDRATEPAERIAFARRLSELYETELQGEDHVEAELAALSRWAADDERNVVPRRRLRKHLIGRGRDAELLVTLDALAAWEDDFEARESATLEAARVAYESLHDVTGAWDRLAPLVEECHEDALELLSRIARETGRAAELAALLVRAAQEAADPELQGRHWSTAAKVFADDVRDVPQALEASLRMLATDLQNREYLAQVDDYAARAQAWPRLNQVYDKLLRGAADDAARVELLLRHANVLDERAHEASEALDRVLRACGLAPNDERLLARAEELARRAGRTEELLVVYDRKRSKTEDDAGKVELLLRAARLCDSALEDRERANTYLKSALAIAKTDAALADEVVRAASELDRKHPDRGADAALRALVRAHREIAEKGDPEVGEALILQAHGLLKDRLGDERGAFDLLRQGLGLFPTRDGLYTVLLERATEWKRLDALDAHLSRAIDDAMDPKTAASLLARRARLLEGPLGRPQEAADAFARLSQLRPDDAEAAAKVRASLRKARRFQDLLLALHKQLQRVKHADDKLALLKEAATTWEHDLKNRWEALDAWRKVLDFAPDDEDARSAVARLDRRSVAPPAPRSVESLFDDDEPTDAGAVKSSATAAAASDDDAQEREREEAEPTGAFAAPESERPTSPPPAAVESSAATLLAAQAEHADTSERDLLAKDLDASTGREPSQLGEDATPTPVPSEPPPSAASDVGLARAPSDELSQLDALLAGEKQSAATTPPEPVDVHVDVSVDDHAGDAGDAGDHRASARSSSLPAPRLTKPPTLPPRRSRSYPPPTPAVASEPAAAPLPASSAPPAPPTSVRPLRAPSLPPPLPGRARMTSAPPPVPSSARPSVRPGTGATVRAPSLPPPLPPSSRTGQHLPSLPGRQASAPPAPGSPDSSSGSVPAPGSQKGPPPLPRKG